MKKTAKITALITFIALLAISGSMAAVFAAGDVVNNFESPTELGTVVLAIPDQAPEVPETGIITDEETTITASDHIYGEEKYFFIFFFLQSNFLWYK